MCVHAVILDGIIIILVPRYVLDSGGTDNVPPLGNVHARAEGR